MDIGRFMNGYHCKIRNLRVLMQFPPGLPYISRIVKYAKSIPTKPKIEKYAMNN
jgi:hypothetical protein